MKKVSLALVCLLTGGVALAKAPASNAFNDVYTVNGGQVLSGSVQSGSVTFNKLNNNQFSITEDVPVWVGPGPGVTQVSLGQDSGHQCTLTIQDQDFNLPQLLNTSCVGGYSVNNFNPQESYTNIEIDLSH